MCLLHQSSKTWPDTLADDDSEATMAVSNTAESNGQPNEFRVILFGPQVTHWTRESLSNLQSVLLQGGSVDFLTRTLAELPSLWSLLEKDYGSQCDFLGAEKLKALSEFARGAGDLSPQSLTNTQIAPLTVVSQIVDFIQASDSQGKKRSLPSFQAAQGFCIGFLSAAALATAKEWAEFETNICNAVRLAACIGIIVDVQEMSLDAQYRAAAISVRWKTAADRAYLETCLDLFPEVSKLIQGVGNFMCWLAGICSNLGKNSRPTCLA